MPTLQIEHHSNEIRMNSKLNYIVNWPELARQANWSAAGLAKTCGISVRTLHRHFIRTMGTNTRMWLAQQRQIEAQKLLHIGASVKETACKVGYKQQSNFTRQFKKQLGTCPSFRLSSDVPDLNVCK